MEENEKKYWLGFSAFPGIGAARFKLLKEYFGTAQAAYLAHRDDLLKVGLGEKLTSKFLGFRNNFSLDGYLKTLKDKEIYVVALDDSHYPRLLKEISDPPFILYVKGKKEPDSTEKWDIAKSIAVVGTRKMTNYGRQVTEFLVRELVNYGLTIVSGLALGVDTAAHRSAISSNGKTIAVLGCGVDVIYPPSNTPLYNSIISGNGFVVSEMPPGLWVSKGIFPARNRIISGLSLGVLVTEGAFDSGALITARFAAEQGRAVFAVPGPITSKLAEGPSILIREGARLVFGISDILEELKIEAKKPSANRKIAADSKEEEIIIGILAEGEKHIDEIVRISQMETGKTAGILTLMEIKGKVRNSGGMIYSINW